jgi:hypothetical protein
MAMPSSTPIVLNSKGTPPARDDVHVGVDDGDEGPVEVVGFTDHAGSSKQRPVGGALEPLLDDITTHGRRLQECWDE